MSHAFDFPISSLFYCGCCWFFVFQQNTTKCVSIRMNRQFQISFVFIGLLSFHMDQFTFECYRDTFLIQFFSLFIYLFECHIILVTSIEVWETTAEKKNRLWTMNNTQFSHKHSHTHTHMPKRNRQIYELETEYDIDLYSGRWFVNRWQFLLF